MYNTKRIIRELTPYRSTAEIFQILGEERDSVFLDSSLVNDLGRYSIIGRNPYLKLLKQRLLLKNISGNIFRTIKMKIRQTFRWCPGQ